MGWAGRSLPDHPVPTPCHGQGHLLLSKVASSPIQPGLEHFQGSRDPASASLGILCHVLTERSRWIRAQSLPTHHGVGGNCRDLELNAKDKLRNEFRRAQLPCGNGMDFWKAQNAPWTDRPG
ncbi:hypothetical protein DV515_00000580 [Chloebia gouldiae]|uniref:Uncharacterized protein n=1 Tax=Chloebia gouldiae TaxID=44316 RepID=A0A3L8T020_CHLGU|nr:hypothetical protein DV515_00000580 [Chloebia gouldiae]